MNNTILNTTNPCDEIIPHLYLGSIKALGTYDYSALDYYMIVDLIKYTLSTDNRDNRDNRDKKTQIYINLPVHDSPDECDKLLSLIKETNVLEKIHLALQQNKPVLVHCFAGMQRSCALVACYLIKYHTMTPDEAINYIKCKRPIAFFGRVNFMETLKNMN
jgi:protein-tyrosine phosphatase